MKQKGAFYDWEWEWGGGKPAGVGSQQQRQPPVVASGASGQGGADAPASNAPSESFNSRPPSTTSFFSSAKSKANEQPYAQAVPPAPAAPAPPSPHRMVVSPAIELPGPTDGNGDSSFDMSLSLDMDALEETIDWLNDFGLFIFICILLLSMGSSCVGLVRFFFSWWCGWVGWIFTFSPHFMLLAGLPIVLASDSFTYFAITNCGNFWKRWRRSFVPGVF